MDGLLPLMLCLIFFATLYRVWVGIWLTVMMLILLVG
jgi:general stress protein CsbA